MEIGKSLLKVFVAHCIVQVRFATAIFTNKKVSVEVPVNLIDWDSDFFPALSLGLFFDPLTAIF